MHRGAAAANAGRASASPRRERRHPGEPLPIDIKKLGRFEGVGHRITGERTGQSRRRGVGWELVHGCFDDNARIAFSQVVPDEKKQRAVAYVQSLGISVEPVMTDNGSRC